MESALKTQVIAIAGHAAYHVDILAAYLTGHLQSADTIAYILRQQ